MGVLFDERSAGRISRVVQTAERNAIGLNLADPQVLAADSMFIVQGRLDAALEQNGTAAMSVYHNEVDSGDNVTIEAGDFVGYVYKDTRCIAYHDGQFWRLVSPRGDMGFGQADAAIAQDATGTVSVYHHIAGTWTDTADNITCRAIGAIASGDRVAWQFDHDDLQFICGCAAS